MLHESTIKREVSFCGIGLHSGKPVAMTLRPAPAGSGVVFRRMDLGSFSIPVREASIISTSYSTTLGIDGVRVQTVEHLLASFYALGIDNLFVELTGEEVPIADGSATPFVNLLCEAGRLTQEQLREVIPIARPITLNDESGRKWIRLTPADRLTISYTIEFDHPLISRQSYLYQHDPDRFIDEIAPARTFGFLKDVKRLMEAGLAHGGSLENAIVVGDKEILNKEGLRFENEFVRHKILDLIGDLALIGRPVQCFVEAHHAGHTLHAELVRVLRQNEKGLSATAADRHPALVA